MERNGHRGAGVAGRARIAWTAATLLLVGLAPATARGDDDARALFKRGVQALRGGARAEAARLFSRSYELSPAAATMCNLALTYDGWGGHEHDALAAYRRCAEDDETGKYRDHALERARALRAAVGDRPPPGPRAGDEGSGRGGRPGEGDEAGTTGAGAGPGTGAGAGAGTGAGTGAGAGAGAGTGTRPAPGSPIGEGAGTGTGPGLGVGPAAGRDGATPPAASGAGAQVGADPAPRRSRALFYAGIASGTASLGTFTAGVLFMRKANAEADDLEARYGFSIPANSDGEAQLDRARRLVTTGDVLYVGAGVFAAAAGALLVVDHLQGRRASVELAPAPGGATVTATWRWP